jgi:RsiW-degrading membrane proteinase PrsW (M82 family)
VIVLAYVIAILLPLFFLYLIYSQDLYGQGKFGHVLLSFGWGLAAFGAAYVVNQLVANHVLPQFGLDWRTTEGYVAVVVLVAPIVEELLKSLQLLFLARRMTYFVDGAIYGFAAGIAFSILENVVIYLPQAGEGAGWMAFIRALSTCLMHGAASALVGTAIGRFRYGRGGHRLFSMLLGWIGAIGLHMGFNRLQNAGQGFGVLLGALGIGIGGAVLIVLFIRWGLAEEKRWIEETLGLGVGVTQREVAVVKQYDQIDELLEPIVERFGEEKAESVETFLLKQAQLGIKRKARVMSQDTREQASLDEEIERLQGEMESIRQQVGVYCMIYVRSIFPEDALALWGSLQRLVEQQDRPSSGVDMWSRLGQRAGGGESAE